MRALIIVVAVAACAAGVARAQVPVDEAMRRLDARRAAAATRAASSSSAAVATTAPTTSPAGTRGKKHQHYAAKAGAPQAIREWIAQQPYIRQMLIAQKQEQLDQEKAALNGIFKQNIGSNVSGRGVEIHAETDRSAEGRWKQEVEAHKRNIAQLAREKRVIEDDTAPRIYTLPMLSPKAGAVAPVGLLKINQVVDATNMIANRRAIGPNDAITDSEGTDIWFKGWDTSDRVDGQQVRIETDMIITGTKTYETVLHGTKTVFVAEPFDVAKWVELVEDTP